MKCPECNHDIPDEIIARHLASRGGSTKGKGKARSSEQARAAVMARWTKIEINALLKLIERDGPAITLNGEVTVPMRSLGNFMPDQKKTIEKAASKAGLSVSWEMLIVRLAPK